MACVRRYRADDWASFIALETEAGLQTLRNAPEADRVGFGERWSAVLRARYAWGDDGPTADGAVVYVLDDEEGAYAGHLFLSERVDARTGRTWLWVTNVAIARPHRSRGFGRLLMERALEEARARGLADVGLDVDADNVVARKLYEEMGFATARLRMHRRTRPTQRPPADTEA